MSGQSVNTNTLSGGHPIINTAVTDANRFKLNYTDNTFSISFSTLQFAQAGQVIYKYRIHELDKEWQTTAPGTNFVTYNNLASGKYTFEVLCHRPWIPFEHKDNKHSHHTSWFQSWWAYLLYSALIVLIVLAFIG